MILRLKTSTSTRLFDYTGDELTQFLRDNSKAKGTGHELQEDIEAFLPGLFSMKAIKGEDESEDKDDMPSFNWSFSTNDVDRHGDIVVQEGMDLSYYKANPVLLWAHDHTRPAIGKTDNLEQTKKALTGTVFFVPKAIDHFAWSIAQKIALGVINAGSVGMGVFDWKYVGEDEEGGEADFMLTKTELREFSMCNVPANPFATRKDDSPKVQADSPAADVVEQAVKKYIDELLSKTKSKTVVPFIDNLFRQEK